MRVFLDFATHSIGYIADLVQLLPDILFFNICLILNLSNLFVKDGLLELQGQLVPNLPLNLLKFLLDFELGSVFDKHVSSLLTLIINAYNFLLVRTIHHLVLQFDELWRQYVLL